MSQFIFVKVNSSYNTETQNILLNLEQIVTVEKMTKPQLNNDFLIRTSAGGNFSYYIDRWEAARILKILGFSSPEF